MQTLARLAFGILMLAVVLFAVGCGGKGLQVEGKVTFDGEPIQDGSISFEPQGGTGHDFGGKIEGGSYHIISPGDVQPGPMVVRIRAARKTGKQIPAGSPQPPGTMVDEVVLIPAIYNDKSNLTETLQSGNINVKNFDLKSDAAKR